MGTLPSAEGRAVQVDQARSIGDQVAYRTDPLTCPIDDLPSLKPALTMVGGRFVFDPEKTDRE